MSQHEPEASPEQQDAVARLLAQARHDEPVPDHVVRRLDTVLAQLAAEGSHAVDPPPPPPGTGTGDNVVDLGARRRRRVTGLLAAAAAVVVVGVGATALIGTDDGDSGTSESAGEPENDGDVGGSSDGGAAQPSEPAPPPDVGPSEGGNDAADDVPPISASTFGTAVRQLQDREGVRSGDGVRLEGKDLTTAPLFQCEATDWGPGRVVAVRYEGRPAVLAYRPVQGSTQVVDLLQCGTGDVLRTTTVPAS